MIGRICADCYAGTLKIGEMSVVTVEGLPVEIAHRRKISRLIAQGFDCKHPDDGFGGKQFRGNSKGHQSQS